MTDARARGAGARSLLAVQLVILLLVAAAAVAIGAYRLEHDRAHWTPDGAIYLRMVLQDRGATPDGARRAANTFVRRTDGERDPESLYTDDPPAYYRDQFALFRNRPLYPALAAALYPRFGPDALKTVSAVAYCAAVIAMYLLLLQVVAPWLAGIGALGLACAPPVFSLAGLPLTDELGLALWIAALGALIAYARTRSTTWLIVLLASTAALTFARPAFYLPLGAALGAYAAAPRGSAARGSAARAAAGIAAIGALFFAYTAAVHGAGLATQLGWQYAWQRVTHGPFAEHGIAGWWSLSVVAALGRELVVDLYKNNMLFTVVLAAFGASLARGTPLLGIVAGGAIATVTAVLVNPVDIQRTVTVPLVPLLVALATLALAPLASAARSR